MSKENEKLAFCNVSARPFLEPHPNGAEHTSEEGGIKSEMVRSATTVFQLAEQDPTLHLDVFEPDWNAIDRDRARASQRGLADRVRFHHRLAFLCPLVRRVIAGTRSRVLVIDRG